MLVIRTRLAENTCVSAYMERIVVRGSFGGYGDADLNI